MQEDANKINEMKAKSIVLKSTLLADQLNTTKFIDKKKKGCGFCYSFFLLTPSKKGVPKSFPKKKYSLWLQIQ